MYIIEKLTLETFIGQLYDRDVITNQQAYALIMGLEKFYIKMNDSDEDDQDEDEEAMLGQEEEQEED